MAKINNPSYAIDIELVEGTNLYLLKEPHNERTIPFLVEAAHFIRDTSDTKQARVILLNGEAQHFDRCGMPLRSALSILMDAFVKGKRDHFLSIVEQVDIDNDGQLQIKINRTKLNRAKMHEALTDNNAIAYQIYEMKLYFDTFASRNLLPEYLAMLGASPDVVRRAIPVNAQTAIHSLPIRFVNMHEKRISLVNRDHPRLGPNIPDIDVG